ncbi:hypothetical protein MTR67_019306, partial [Solanum verrucosum]
TFGIPFFPDCPLYPSWDNPSSILVYNSCSSFLPTKENLNYLPGHCSCYTSERTLRAGKLNEKILKLFIATGKEEILSLIGAFNIQCVLTPVLPTRCSEKF